MIRLSKMQLERPIDLIADEIARTYSVFEIARTCAELLKQKNELNKITITPDQFATFFKIQGVKDNTITFTREYRGRKPMTEKARMNGEKVAALFNGPEDYGIDAVEEKPDTI